MRPIVLLNPVARGGRNRRLHKALEGAFRDIGAEAQIIDTAEPGDAERLAREHAGADLVVVAGGDGTVHEVVNGLVGTGATLGVLPLGTGNDYAHALGMPNGLAAAVRALAAAPTVPVDVGRVRWVEDGGTEQRSRVFANGLGVGFDAHVAVLASETKWLGGRAAYLAAVLRTLWKWRRPDIIVRVTLAESARQSGEARVVFEGPLFLCEIGNGHSVGGGFHLTPDARPDDGCLDVCLVRHMMPRRALRLLPRTFSGTHVGAPEVQMSQAQRIEIDVEAGVVALQADGEVLSFTARRMEAEVLPAALSVRALGLGK